jgi:hypothetical protein
LLTASRLQNAGSIAAIVGASIALLLLLASILRWWWRRHRVRSVNLRIFKSGEEPIYLGITELPASTALVTALVSDGKTTKKFGPSAYRRDIGEEVLFNLRLGQPLLDDTVEKYRVELFTVSDHGDRRRVFKGRVRTPG